MQYRNLVGFLCVLHVAFASFAGFVPKMHAFGFNPEILTLWFTAALLVQPALLERRPNVLFITVDDMRTALPSSSSDNDIYPKPLTPNLDRLGESSFVMENAYTQYSLCGPSRSSLLTSRRPDTTRVFTPFGDFRKEGGDFTTLPLYFKSHGYKTLGIGKILDIGLADKNDAVSWSEPYYFPEKSYEAWTGAYQTWRSVPKCDYQDNPLPDQLICDTAIERLQSYGSISKTEDHPFFMAVGFLKPHLPFVFPEEYLSQTEFSKVGLPYVPEGWPHIAWHDQGELTHYGDIVDLNVSVAYNQSIPEWKASELRRAYFASVTYIDHLLGRLLDELERLELVEDTIVVFLGDHGFHLGDQAMWTKKTLFDIALHAPLVIRIPGLKAERISELVEFVDIFPTVVEAAGLPPLPICPKGEERTTHVCREGSSFLPLLKHQDASWKNVIFSQCQRETYMCMGYSLRTPGYRYTEWVSYDLNEYAADWEKVMAMELYDFSLDHGETFNHAKQPEYADIRGYLSDLLHRGWRDVVKNTGTARLNMTDKISSLNGHLPKISTESEKVESNVPQKVKRRFIRFR